MTVITAMASLILMLQQAAAGTSIDVTLFDSPPTTENKQLLAVEHEVKDAITLSYASAYWMLANRLKRHDAPELRSQLRKAAIDTLLKLPATEDRDATLRTIELELANPEMAKGWFESPKSRNWTRRPDFYTPPDALRPTIFGQDRRTCRLVAAVLFDHAVQSIIELKINPNEHNYWSLEASSGALHESLMSCPDPHLSTEPLLMDLFTARWDVWAELGKFQTDYWPAELPEPEQSLNDFEVPIGTALAVDRPHPDTDELISIRDDLAERTITYWKRGPDNFLVRRWNRWRNFLEGWPY